MRPSESPCPRYKGRLHDDLTTAVQAASEAALQHLLLAGTCFQGHLHNVASPQTDRYHDMAIH